MRKMKGSGVEIASLKQLPRRMFALSHKDPNALEKYFLETETLAYSLVKRSTVTTSNGSVSTKSLKVTSKTSHPAFSREWQTK